jgi:hypothetical protein
VRFADTRLIDLAADGMPVDLEFAFTLSALAKLVLTARGLSTQAQAGGPRRCPSELRIPWRENDTAGRMLTATLTNDLNGIVYA